ncbi:MAG: 5'-nucleotidase C-terminal domain-containing protein [Planctomycetota bacterium]
MKARTWGLLVGFLAALTGASVDAQVTIQMLHASDLEGGVGAIDDAPNFAAIVEALENAASGLAVPSVLLSAGDNYIPGPFFSAAGDPVLRQPLRDALGEPAAREGVGRVDVAIMNLIGFDAAAIGNHEFDAGAGVYREIIGTDIRDANLDGTLDEARWLGTQFPYLSSNLDFSADPALAGLFTSAILPNTAFRGALTDLPAAAAAPKLAQATIIDLGGGEFLGVVGATTPLLESISSPGDTTVVGPGAGSNDMMLLAQILQPVIDSLLMASVNKIVLVSHLQQITLEQQLLPLLHGVDIAVAGGSDTLLADGTDVLRAGDVAAGPYPIVTTNADLDPALVVSTDGQYSYVGRLVVTFDASGVVQVGSIDANVSGAYATDDAGVTALWGNLVDPFAPGTKGAAVESLTAAVRGVVIAKDANILGRTDVFIEGRRTQVRTEETNLGNLSADANLAAALLVDPTTLVSIKNGGGIRAAIGAVDGVTGDLLPTAANPEAGKLAGDISQLDIENSLRFNNRLSLLTVTAQQLKAIAEHGVAATGPGATPGQFPQIGGMSFSFDPSLPVGQRVRSLAVPLAPYDPIVVLDGAVVGNPNRPIRIVTLDFLANGGDNYPFPSFTTLNPSFANRVDLSSVAQPAGAATFAAPGSEQDALAEYLAATFLTTPYGDPDTASDQDQRLQNLSRRMDTVAALVAQVAFQRGDCNDDAVANIADAVYLVDALFAGGPIPNCQDACDANDDGLTNVADVVFLAQALFAGGSQPPAPGGVCGQDPTADAIGCSTASACP